MKKILLLLTLVLAFPAYAWDQRKPNTLEACQVHAPYGFPKSVNAYPICRQGYLSGYDRNAKIPNYVTYELLPQNAVGCVPRSNAFTTDQSIRSGATPNDYNNSGYDKGHMAPDGDMSWDEQVELESFLMTNMSPQAPSLNRGIWKLLEDTIRNWAIIHNQSFTIYVGGFYNNNNKRIGKGVTVPSGFYKIVINNQTNEVAGWAFPHDPPYPNLGNNLIRFRTPIANIQKISGVEYAFPPNAIELQPGKEWSVNLTAYQTVKRQKCSKSE